MGLAARMWHRLGINVVRVVTRDLGRAAQARCTRPNVECRVLSEQAVLDFALDPRLELNAVWVHQAYARGEACLGAFKDRGLVGYTWLAFGNTRFAGGVSIRFGSPFRYSYRSFVRPEYRGQRIEQALYAVADRAELRRGRAHGLSFAELDRPQRAGAATLGYVAYFECFGLLVAVRSPGVRNAGIEFYRPWRFRIAARMRAWPTPTGT